MKLVFKQKYNIYHIDLEIKIIWLKVKDHAFQLH